MKHNPIGRSALAITLLATASAKAIDVPVADDAMVISSSAANNQGAHINLNVSGLASSLRYSYLKFNVAAFVPAGTRPDDIEKAVIRLYPSVVTTAGTIAIHNVTSVWVEGKKNNTTASAGELSWNLRPTEDATPEATVPIALVDADEFLSLDVTILLKEWLTVAPATPATPNFGIVLKPAAASPVNVAFDSKENITNTKQPTLDVTLVKKRTLPRGDLGMGAFTTGPTP